LDSSHLALANQHLQVLASLEVLHHKEVINQEAV
jgi:hypothetical protein